MRRKGWPFRRLKIPLQASKALIQDNMNLNCKVENCFQSVVLSEKNFRIASENFIGCGLKFTY